MPGNQTAYRETCSLSQAAQRKQWSYMTALNHLLRGDIEGFRDDSGRWRVYVDSLLEHEA